VRRSRSAYTLFELLLVMAILVVLAAVSYPSLDSMFATHKAAAAADQVRAAWAEARSHAVDEGRAYRFAIVPNKGNFRVAPDGGDFWSGNGPPVADDPTNAPFILEETLPKGVIFTSLESAQSGSGPPSGDTTALPSGSIDPATWSSVATFLPDGSTLDNVDIVFQTRGARPLGVSLRALTGVVTVRQLGREGTGR